MDDSEKPGSPRQPAAVRDPSPGAWVKGDESLDPSFTPRAVFRLSLIEFWERYSFYTTFALLALFAAAPVVRGGLGWSNAQSLRFFGAYLLAVQLTPTVGGFLTDRWLGQRLSLRIGAAGLSLGHVSLAASAFIPIIHLAGGSTLAQSAARAGTQLGRLDVPNGLAGAEQAYFAASLCFYLGVTLIAIGNGLFKPILTVVVGRLPHRDAAARTHAFTTFFFYINVGGLLSVVLGGWLAQTFGWGWAFGGSAAGMLVAIATMVALDRRYLRPFLAGGRTASASMKEEAISPRALLGIGAVLLLLVLCSAFSYQSYGFVSLFTAQLVQRDVGGFVIPPTWFTALNPITIMVLTPVFLRTWRRGGLGHDWTTVQHFAAALLLMAVGFLPLVAGTIQATHMGLANPGWVATAIVIIAASELLYSPAGMAASTRIAPERMQTLAMGSQSAATGFGAWLSGQIGAAAFESDKTVAMTAIAVAAVVAATGLWLARKRFAAIDL